MNVDDYPFDPDAVYRARENVAWLEKRKAELIAKNDLRRIDRFGKWYLKHVATENIDVPDDAYFDGAQTSIAIEKMKTLGGGEKPFFLAVGYYRPHLPFNVPKQYWDLYDRQSIPLAENRFLPKKRADHVCEHGARNSRLHGLQSQPTPARRFLYRRAGEVTETWVPRFGQLHRCPGGSLTAGLETAKPRQQHDCRFVG